jgi:lactoylglutathione lyase
MALIHTCYRITDIDRSVAFYEALGFHEVGRLPIKDEAVNVFMNQPGDGNMPRLELTYNYGVDSYEIGSGYGHIAITATDLDGTLARLAQQGIEPEKPPYSVREGGSRLCFVRDPDGSAAPGPAYQPPWRQPTTPAWLAPPRPRPLLPSGRAPNKPPGQECRPRKRSRRRCRTR